MSNYSLLNAEEVTYSKNSKLKKFLSITAIVLVISLASVVFLIIKKTSTQATNTDISSLNDQEKRVKEQARRTVLSYLAMPTFAGTTLELQTLGRAHLELFDVPKQELYFSLPEFPKDSAEKDFKPLIQNFLANPNKIETASEVNNVFVLGNYRLAKSERKAIFFKTSAENFQVDPNTLLKFSFQRGVYSLTIDQLSDFLTNKNVYGGKIEAIAEEPSSKTGKTKVFANHGVMVAKPNDPTLTPFVKILTKDIDRNDPLAREKIIQHLLDFVTNEIEYDKKEALSSYETLKRPNETLMNRGADCSNKTILMASFLEQIGEDYLLLYCPGHITIAVKKGNFPSDNKLTFNWENATWVIAETTTPNFTIGVDLLQKPEIFHQVQYVQHPNQKDIIINTVTGKAVNFL